MAGMMSGRPIEKELLSYVQMLPENAGLQLNAEVIQTLIKNVQTERVTSPDQFFFNQLTAFKKEGIYIPNKIILIAKDALFLWNLLKQAGFKSFEEAVRATAPLLELFHLRRLLHF